MSLRRVLLTLPLALVVLVAAVPLEAGAEILLLEGDAEVVAVTPLSGVEPMLIDPTGITYLPDRDALILVDSEIDEEPSIFAGFNMITTDRSLGDPTGSLAPGPGGADEPTGLAYDSVERTLILTNDSTDEVVMDQPGSDGRYGTEDDVVSVPDYSALELSDLEDVAFDADDRVLYLLEASTQTVYRITPGKDGVFDGVSPAGDDSVSAIQLAPIGILDATGLEFVPGVGSLLVTDSRRDAILEVSKAGVLVRDVDLSPLKISGVALAPNDLTIAPASDGSGAQHVYVVDRGNDNGTPGDGVPPPTDGRVIELAMGFGDGRFIDDDDSVFQEDIEWLAEQGVTLGCNPPANDRYCPDDPVTRGQMSAFLVRALDLTDGAGSNVFRDDDGSVFEADIDRLATAGVLRGCNPPASDLACPGELVSRAQMAAFLVRALDLPAGSPDLFLDDDGSVFESDIDALATAGVTRGCNPPANDLFCPESPVTRGQMAGFLRRALG